MLILGQAGAVSGGDVHAIRLAEGWRRRGASVTLIGSPDLTRFVAPDVGSIVAPLSTPFDASMRTNPFALAAGLLWRGVKALPRLRRCDIVVAGSHLVFDVAPAALAAVVFRKPIATYVYHVIGDMHRSRSVRSTLATSLEAVSFAMLRWTRATVFYDNDDARAGLVRRRFRAERLHPTENAYDPIVAVPEHKPVAPRRLLFVGRLVEQKGVWDIVALARALREHGSDIEIHIVGDGPLRERLEHVIATEGLDRVHLLGFVSEEEKWRLLSTSSLFLAPSREEGWGIAVGEALLAGVPVVALDLPAYSHFRTTFERARPDGSDFVDRAIAIALDEAALRHRAELARRDRDLLPRWSTVIARDLYVLAAGPSPSPGLLADTGSA